MELQFLGTGAGEGIPPLFARSEKMKRLRDQGGYDLRTRSALRIGEHHQIDFGPDAFFQSVRCKCDFYDLEHLIVTHTHSDHFQLEGILSKEMPDETNGKPLTIYVSEPGLRWIEQTIGVVFGRSKKMQAYINEYFPFVAMDYFASYEAGDLRIETVKGSHGGSGDGESSVNPLLTFPDGKRLLYASDTGFYQPATWEYLTGKHADLVIMEATFGGMDDRDPEPRGHLDAYSLVRMVTRLAEIGFLDESTPVYATHINPKHNWDHAAMQRFFDATEFAITTAYDCLTFQL